MGILSTYAGKHAALVEIVACAKADVEIVNLVGVVVAHRGAKHEAVGGKIAHTGIEAEAEVFFRTVGTTYAGKRGAHVFLSLLKLCVSGKAADEEAEEDECFFHCSKDKDKCKGNGWRVCRCGRRRGQCPLAQSSLV